VTHRSLLLGPADLTMIDGIPATTPTRILIDSGLVVPKLVLELGLEDCRRRGYLNEHWLLRQLERLGAPLRKGSRPLVDILLERDPSWAPLESVLELGVWDLIRSSDLPLPVRQHEVVVDGKKYRIDLAYTDDLVAVEPSGFRWHSGRLRWGIDQRRAGELASVGWRIVPVTWWDLQHEPDVVLRLIRRALTMAA
jgi:very-short-patch-repair endonuclease